MSIDLSTTHARRKALLSQLLDVGPDHFDMTMWAWTTPARSEMRDAHSLFPVLFGDIDVNDCGTTACLAGHLAVLAHNAGVSFDWTDARVAEHDERDTDDSANDDLAWSLARWVDIPYEWFSDVRASFNDIVGRLEQLIAHGEPDVG